MNQAINLLPWRDTARQQVRKRLGKRSLLLAALTGSLCLGAQVRLQEELDQAQAAVHRIQAMHRHLDWQDTALAVREEQLLHIDSRLHELDRLDRQRQALVTLLTDVASATPAGLRIDSILRQGEHILIEGRTRSATRVSTLSDRLDATLETLRRLPDDAGQEGTHGFRLRLAWSGAVAP